MNQVKYKILSNEFNFSKVGFICKRFSVQASMFDYYPSLLCCKSLYAIQYYKNRNVALSHYTATCWNKKQNKKQLVSENLLFLKQLSQCHSTETTFSQLFPHTAGPVIVTDVDCCCFSELKCVCIVMIHICATCTYVCVRAFSAEYRCAGMNYSMLPAMVWR